MNLRRETRAEAREIEFAAPPPGALTWTPVLHGEVPEDRIVRAAFRHLLTAAHGTSTQTRELGRSMGREARGGALPAYLDAFSHLGLGEVALTSAEPERYVVEGRALLGAEQARSLTCALALGFVEGAIGVVEGREALGAEMQCRSRGAPVCVFHIRPRKDD